MKRLLIAWFVLTGIAPLAHAETAVIRISGYVPVICHADFSPAEVQQGDLIQLGTVKEFCNDGNGYQLIADHSAGSNLGELVLDGQPVPLDSSGRTLLARMSGPRSITQTLSYRPGATAITTISIEVLAASI